MLPIITPPFVVGVAIIVLFGRTVIVTVEVAEWFAIRPTRWIYGLPGILMAQVLAFSPVTFLAILSGLEAINPTLEEASTTLGARPVTTFFTVTWPLLRPAFAAAFLLAFIESLADLGNPIVLGGSYDVLSTKIFFAVVGAQYDLGQAATLPHARAREILEQVGLADLEARLPTELSGGQQQRVAVARAIVQQPDVILFDEPLSNVDAKLRRKVREEIRSLQRRFGLTAVYVTHDREEALAVSDRIVVMDRGRIAQSGTPAALYERPASPFIADFIGDANLIQGTVAQGRFFAPGLVLELSGPDGPATLSIRPERIALTSGGTDRLVSATYLGSRMEYVVAAEAGELLVSRPITEATFAVGDAVSAGIASTDVSRVA